MQKQRSQKESCKETRTEPQRETSDSSYDSRQAERNISSAEDRCETPSLKP